MSFYVPSADARNGLQLAPPPDTDFMQMNNPIYPPSDLLGRPVNEPHSLSRGELIYNGYANRTVTHSPRHWACGDRLDLEYWSLIGSGAFGEVHKVERI